MLASFFASAAGGATAVVSDDELISQNDDTSNASTVHTLLSFSPPRTSRKTRKPRLSSETRRAKTKTKPRPARPRPRRRTCRRSASPMGQDASAPSAPPSVSSPAAAQPMSAEDVAELVRLAALFDEAWDSSVAKSPDKSAALLREVFSGVKPAKPLQSLPAQPSECQVCFSEFDDVETPRMVMDECQHGMVCLGCFQRYLGTRIADEDVLPWVPCPDEACTEPIHVRNIVAVLSPADLARFAQIFLRKMLARQDEWVQCTTDGCEFGFATHELDEGESRTVTCKLCDAQQEVSREKPELDDDWNAMVEEGVLRPCPKCDHLMFKEKGICNVVCCPQCSQWWNWQTRETGSSQRELKQRARWSGTLWLPGELAYQQRLQRTDPEAFKALLARAGVKYDPNYVRGQG